jgi:large conductance mechanosensitive channel
MGLFHEFKEITMGLVQEFKEFAMKGSVVDLAVGVVIGGAFGNVVNSLVKDVMMPPLGLLMGGRDFSNKVITLHKVYDAGKVIEQTDLRYGVFLNNVINFLIVAASIFIVIKLMNIARRRLEHPAPAAAPTIKECPMCTSAIPIKARKCPQCTADLPAVA